MADNGRLNIGSRCLVTSDLNRKVTTNRNVRGGQKSEAATMAIREGRVSEQKLGKSEERGFFFACSSTMLPLGTHTGQEEVQCGLLW